MIKADQLIRRLLWIQLLVCLVSEIIYSYNTSFSILFFTIDVICITNIFITIYMDGMKIVLNKNNVGMSFAALFCVYVVISYLWSSGDWYSAVIRYRYILVASVTFYMTARFLDDDMFSRMVDLMECLMYVDLVLCAYQNIVMGLHPDFCNGIFGFTGYANGVEGMYCLIMAILATVCYIDGVWNSFRSGCLVLAASVVCALAEIKIFYVMLVVAIVMIVLIKSLNDHNYKKVKRIIGTIIAIVAVLYVAYRILTVVMPENLRVFQNLSNAMFYEERSTYAGRTNAISFIKENQFRGNILLSIFGSGLGSSAYNYIYELGKVFSEQGYFGIVLLALMLLGSGIQNFFNKRMDTMNVFNMVYGVLMLISVVVWNTTFTRAAGLVFMVLGFQNVKYINKRDRKISNE